ncbi:MAG: cytochrome c [Planctomycetales bacterium]|nr:cytochrome c [Planctomycetales bacterium]
MSVPFAVLAVVGVFGATGGRADEAAEPSAVPHDLPGLEHVLHAAGRVFSGSEPLGKEGFATLQRLGFRTVVSVDGAGPALDLAHRYGLRYVHIPIGYGGVSRQAGRSLARVAADCPGKIYVHCHHGQHRGPAAAAIVCRAAGDLDASGAVDLLQRAGTSADYAGLWRDVANYRSPAPGETLPKLVEHAQVASFAAAMAVVDRYYDNVKLVAAAEWMRPAAHPDLEPVQTVLLLRESLREAGRLKPAFAVETDFPAWLRQSESVAADIETSLRNGDHATAGREFARLKHTCSQCHAKYRN